MSLLRILWIGQAASSSGAGDTVYDEHLIAACIELGAKIDRVQLRSVRRLRELGALLRGIPYYRARFDSEENRASIRDSLNGHDCVVCSWEPLDRLGYGLGVPTLPILHNVTHRSLVAMYPSNPLMHALAHGAKRWERRAYGSRSYPCVAVLSLADQAAVRGNAPKARLAMLPPGMPPAKPLSDMAIAAPELILSGSFEWAPKRRDLMRFAQEYKALGLSMPIFAAALPTEARRLLPLRPHDEMDSSAAIRFGVITDRFCAGFKLKSTAYLAQNAVVLSFVDIRGEFEAIPDSELFVRYVARTKDIPQHIDFIAKLPPAELRERFSAFKVRCREHFNWRQTGRRLLSVLSELSGKDYVMDEPNA